MQGVLDYSKYLDIFSQNTSFVHEGKINYRTYFGVFLSVLVIAASIVVALMFGSEVYKRRQPNVAMSQEYLKTSTVDIRKWPAFFIFSDADARQLNNDNGEYYDLLVGKANFTDNNLDHMGSYDKLNITKCTIDNFSYALNFIKKEDIESFLDQPTYCVQGDEEAYFSNTYKAPNSTFMLFLIDLCDVNKRKCADDLDYVKKETYVQMYFLNTYIDSMDFYNPIKYYIDSINQQITDTLLKRNFVRIVEDVYVSDNGWMLEDKTEVSFYTLVGIKTEINNISPKEPNSRLWITMESPNVRTKTNRSYMKVQDLFAKVGGIVNAFMIIITIVFGHFLRFNYIMKIRENLNPKKDNTTFEENKFKQIINENSIKNNNSIKIKMFNNFDEDKKPNELNSNNNSNTQKTLINNILIRDNINNKEISSDNSKFPISLNNYISINEKNETNNSHNFKEKLNELIRVANNEQNSNTENKLESNKIQKLLKPEGQENLINKTDLEHLEFKSLSYINFIYSFVCRKSTNLKLYDSIRLQIDKLLDIMTFTSFIQKTYAKVE